LNAAIVLRLLLSISAFWQLCGGELQPSSPGWARFRYFTRCMGGGAAALSDEQHTTAQPRATNKPAFMFRAL